MTRFFKIACLIAAMAVVPQVAVASPVSAITFTGFPASANFDMNIGWVFRVNQRINVFGLGYYDLAQDGLAGPHTVGLFALGQTSALFSTQVAGGTGATLIDGFRYTTSSTSLITLNPGLYAIMANNPATDAWVGAVTGFAVNPLVTFGTGAVAVGGSALQAPTDTVSAYDPNAFGPNMLISAVPEPSSILFLASGIVFVAVLGRRKISIH